MAKFQKYRNIIAAVAILLISIFMFILSFTVKRETMSTIGPGFMPRLVSCGMFLLGLIHLNLEWKQMKEESREDEQPVLEDNAVKSWPDRIRDCLDWLSAGVILCYVLLVGTLGFILSSAIYMFLQMLLLASGEKKNYIKIGLLSVIVPVLVYELFTNYFYLMLPAGIIG